MKYYILKNFVISKNLVREKLLRAFAVRRLWKHVKRSVALTLSFTMLVQPLHAYDSDLISIAAGAAAAGKPNVLLILDTSDSMNLGLPWAEVSVNDATTYNSHVEYLWNNEDYIARIGCYDTNQDNCRKNAATLQTKFDDSTDPAKPSLNHAPLTYNDAYTFGSLPQGYFISPELKNKAYLYAQGVDDGDPSRKRSDIRDYSGIDSLHGDRGGGQSPNAQASPCKFLLAPGGAPINGGQNICATPIKSKYVWWTMRDVSSAGSSSSATVSGGGGTFLGHGVSDPTNPSTTDPSLFSDSFNRFVGEDTVTPFSSIPAGGYINRGGTDFFTSRGANDYLGGFVDMAKLRLVSSKARANRCMSSYFGARGGYTSGFVPSTVNAPSPFEKNAGYMSTGWVRWQPFRNTVRDNFTFPDGWKIDLKNYPGPFGGAEDGQALGWRDNFWLPPRIKQDGVSDAGWEPLQPDLGSFSDYFNAVLNLLGHYPGCSGAWSDYCDGGDAGRASATPTASPLARDAVGQGRWAAKLPRVLAYYGIDRIPDEISRSMDYGRTPGNPANYRIVDPSGNTTGDMRWSFAALRGGNGVSGPAGSLPGISTYYDGYRQVGDVCPVTCKPKGTNPSSFDTVSGINKTVYSYPSEVACEVGTVGAGCNPAVDCTPGKQTIPIRQFTSCQWKNRNSSSAPGQEGAQTVYSGGTCAATCTGDCDNFNSTTPIANVGNNNIGPGESATTVVSSTLRCNYAKDGAGNPANTTGSQGACSDINPLPNPAEVNCPTWYDKSGTAHPTCIFYSGSTPSAVCPTVNSPPLTGVTGLKYNFDRADSSDSFYDCTADNARDSAQPTLAGQVDHFNPSLVSTGTVGLNVDVGAKFPFGTGYNGDGSSSYSTTTSTPSNIVAYSSNYLNYKFGPKGPNGRPIGRQTRLQLAKDVLVDIVTGAYNNQFRFGLMAFNDPDANGSRGARVIFPVSDLTTNTVTNGGDDTAEFRKRILWLEAHSKTPLAPALYEAYLYYANKAPSKEASDIYNDTSGTLPSTLKNIVIGGNYFSPIDATFAASASLTAAQRAYCLKNVIILITDGGPQDDDGKNTQIEALSGKAADGSTVGTTPQLVDSSTKAPFLPFGPPDDKYRNFDGTYTQMAYSYLDEITNFLNKTSVRQVNPSDKSFNNVTTFTIGFAGATSPVLQNAGDPNVSGGKYYDANDAKELQDAIKNSLQSTREFVPTLSTPVTPLSALSKSQDADEIYVSTIKPSGSLDIWPGNMKKYRAGSGEQQCGTQTQTDAQGKQTTTPVEYCLIGQDAVNGHLNIAPAEIVKTGTSPVAVISSLARSYWSNDKDGNNSLLGGILNRLPATYQSQGVPDVSQRIVYTHISNMFDAAATLPAGQESKLPDFNFSNTDVVDSAAFRRVASAQRKAVINKIRGADITKPECSDPGNSALCQTFDNVGSHTAPMHSPGVIVTYEAAVLDGTGAIQKAPLQRLFYVTINGMLHAVDPSDEKVHRSPGNIGKEMWGFVPEEVLAQAADHPYLTPQNKSVDGPIALFDGQPNVWLKPCKKGVSKSCNGDVEQAILYFGMRRGAGDWSASQRGAHSFYAMDITQEDAPKMLWKITSVPNPNVAATTANPDPRIGYLCGADGKCEVRNDYSELGQTWSTPTPVKLNARSTSKTGGGTQFIQGLVFTGGYDARQDCVLPDKNSVRRVRVLTGRKNDRDCTNTGEFDTEGRAIYVVDALSGEPIVTFMDDAVERQRGGSMKGVVIHPVTVSGTPGTSPTGTGLRMSNSIAGAVSANNIDLDAANTTDRLYVGDMGGVLWRVDMQNTDPTKWAVYPIASLSTSTGNGNVLNDRPIFFQPQVLLSSDSAALSDTNGQDKYDYVYIPTSDFEHPIETGKSVNNKLFMVKDWESRGTLVATGGSVSADKLKPAIVGEFNNLGHYSSGTYKSEILNVTPYTVKPGEINPQAAVSLQLPPNSASWENLNGWYIDFDIDPTTGKQYTDSNVWVEVATGPVLVNKNRNPASPVYGMSILTATTYRYGAIDLKNCTASGVGYTLIMDATTGAAIMSPSATGGGGGKNNGAAALVSRIGTPANGGYTSGGGTTTGVSATPALKVINCQIVKVATAGSLAYSVEGEACTASKAYWYNQLSN